MLSVIFCCLQIIALLTITSPLCSGSSTTSAGCRRHRQYKHSRGIDVEHETNLVEDSSGILTLTPLNYYRIVGGPKAICVKYYIPGSIKN